jgi:hypothetical protein
MKIKFNKEEMDLVLDALNFVFECEDYKPEDQEWLEEWLKKFRAKSGEAGDLLDRLSMDIGVS